jgi:hypothetical protein
VPVRWSQPCELVRRSRCLFQLLRAYRHLGAKPIWRRGEGSKASGPLDQIGAGLSYGQILACHCVPEAGRSDGHLMRRWEPASTTSTPTTSISVPPAAQTTSIAPTTTATEPLAVNDIVSPDHVVTGTVVTFTVEIRGPGTGDAEDVRFGDGGTSGANAGMIKCGDTARADHTSTYTHSYAAPGTYQFSDEVEVMAPHPSAHGRTSQAPRPWSSHLPCSPQH